MRKNKEDNAAYMRQYRASKKDNDMKSVDEQRREAIGTFEDHCIDESIYDVDCPKYRSDKTEYTKQEIADNHKWVEDYLKKIGRFGK